MNGSVEARRGSVTFHFADLWEEVAAAVPNRLAVTSGAIQRTFSELDVRATALADGLAAKGVRPGSRVAVMLSNVGELLEVYLAAFKLRATPINVNYRFTGRELEYLAHDAGVVGFVLEPGFASVVADARGRSRGDWWTLATGPEYGALLGHRAVHADVTVRSSDDEYVIYTGGTTGYPKGVIWRMEDAFHACIGGGRFEAAAAPIEHASEIRGRIVSPQVTFLPAAPLMHAAGIWPTLRWLFAGGHVVLLERFDPTEIWRAVSRFGVNVLNIVADAMARPLIEALASESHDLSSLRMIGSGGAPLSNAAREALAAACPGLTIRDIYGSSETGVQIWRDWTSGGEARNATFETVLVDAETKTVVGAPGGEPGVSGLVARHTHVPLGYVGDQSATDAVFVTRDGVRLAVTGDAGLIDDAGNLRVLGRGVDCINSGGEKIYPREVEDVLLHHSAVHDAMVVGVPDDRWGEQAVALIVVEPGVDVDDAALASHCRGQLAGYKTPKAFVRVEALKRTSNGKPDYKWGRQEAAASKGRGGTRG